MDLKRTFGKFSQSVGGLWMAGIIATSASAIGVNRLVSHDLDGDLSVVSSVETEGFKSRAQQLTNDSNGSMDVLLADLLISPKVNEKTYTQFAEVLGSKYFPYTYSYDVSYTARGKSLNECRDKHLDNVAASKIQIADNIADCMKRNGKKTGLLTFLTLLGGGMFLLVSLGCLYDSREMKSWASREKIKKPKPN